MGKYINISIPQGCTENWNEMQPDENGRYCGFCNKSVIDFTAMTDTQLATFFKKGNDHICGRFFPDQLQLEIAIPKKELPWLKYFFTITIPALLFSEKSNAQSKEKQMTVSKPVSTKPENTLLSYGILKGTVNDERGLPVEGASLRITGTQYQSTTDAAGNFRIHYAGNNKQILVSGIGIGSTLVPIPKSRFMNICINREKDTKKYDVVNVVAGGIGIRRTKKTNLADRSVQKKDIPCKINTSDIFSRHIITTEKFSVYPNPVLPDSFLHFSLNDSASKKQTVEIFSAKGDLVQKEITAPVSNSGQIHIGRLPKGYYIIRVTDLKQHTIHSKEFYVR